MIFDCIARAGVISRTSRTTWQFAELLLDLDGVLVWLGPSGVDRRGPIGRTPGDPPGAAFTPWTAKDESTSSITCRFATGQWTSPRGAV